MINPIKLSPFKRFCVTIGNLPTTYMESLSYYEMLEWLCNYLEKTVIPAINNNSEALEEVQSAFIELKNFVDNYFDNLDIQEEINNKLDEMAESGQLTDIIAQYLNLAGVLVYDTISDLEDATNVVDGSSCYTLGKDTYNDGKGNFYKIRTITISDVIDGYNIVAINNSQNLIAERLDNFYINETNNRIDETNDNFNNNKQGTLNMMNDIIYDIGSTYTQGIAIKDNILYVYTNNEKLLKFNLTSHTYINETSINLEHGNDFAIIGDYMYVATANGTNKILKYSINNNTTEEITLNIDETQIASICKENENNLLLIGNTGYGTSFANSSFYRYNINNGNLTKLTFTSKTVINYYATQSMEYLNGYIYFLVNNPDQLIKIKVDGNNLTLENIYNLPTTDNIGLDVGEYEGISRCEIYGENCLMISAHIFDCDEVGRTVKFYVINPINNVPESPFYTPNIPYYTDMEHNNNIYVDNTSTLLETGTYLYPFHTLGRALNVAKNKKDVSNILLKNSSSTNPYNLYCGTIYKTEVNIICDAANIIFNFQRIVDSKIHFDNNTRLTIKNKVYSGKDTYGTITNSTVSFRLCYMNIQDGYCFYNSIIDFYDTSGEVNNSDTYVFRERYNTVLTEGINWSNISNVGTKYYHYIAGVATLKKISDMNINTTDQTSFFNNHVYNAGSTAYCVIFGGKHYTD